MTQKTAMQVFNPLDNEGKPRAIIPADAQDWGTWLESAIETGLDTSAYVRNNLPLVLGGHQKINGGINIYAGGFLSGNRKDYGILVESFEPTIVLQDLSTNAGALALHFNHSTFNIFYKNTNDGTISKDDVSLFRLTEGHCRYLGQDMYHTGSRATQAEAEAGTSSTTIMTPQRTRQAIDSRTLYNVINDRTGGTSYQNTTNKTMTVNIAVKTDTTRYYQVSSDGTNWITVGMASSASSSTCTFDVKSGWWYRIDGGIHTKWAWTELR